MQIAHSKASMRPDTPTIKEIINVIDKQFMDQTGYQLDVFNPETFNQKIQWLKLFYNHPLLETAQTNGLYATIFPALSVMNFLSPQSGCMRTLKKYRLMTSTFRWCSS
jgi:hypothetical protein